jgi:NAD(P)-dependent dehydrogenase (short-subunit alcohol dehydrogenase family)
MSKEKGLMPGRLAGKVAIVTGAASRGPGVGTGKATAILFAREGAKVLLVNRSESRAQELQREIEQDGGECSVCPTDITNASEVERMVETTIERYGKLDILVNNVGFGALGTVVTITEDVWDNLMNVNLKSMMWCSKYSIPRMIASGGGSIINVSSLAGIVAARRKGGLAAYAASKAGVHGLTLSMAADFGADGIRVNCLLVGTPHTPVAGAYRTAGPHSDEERERRRRAVPLQAEGTGWDVGWAAVYLASDEARWITGAFLPVDGGLMMFHEA